MTETFEEESKPSNRKLWWALGGVSAVVVGGLLLMSGVAAPGTPTGAGSSAAANTSSAITKPTITSVATTNRSQDIVFTVKTSGADTSKVTLEYEVADQNREVKAQGKTHTADFEASTKLTDSAYYRIKVRAVDSNGTAGEWSDSYTVKLADLSNFKTLQPDPAYYKTGWATGADTSMQAAQTAVGTAWNIEEVTNPAKLKQCLPLNTGDMTPKLLLPPMPSVVPSGVTLKFVTEKWAGQTLTITYVWCE